ncbi:MAG: hypothetical protein ACRC35_11165 [Angustibacter sp.]
MAWVAACATAVTLLIAAPAGPARALPVPQICTGTWNIAQGTAWGTIGEMISGRNLTAFAVQEIGTTLPPGAREVSGTPNGRQPVLEYSWAHNGEQFYLYLATGNINRAGALRVGIVTRQRADNVRYVADPGTGGQTGPDALPTNPGDIRPAVGVHLGGRWFFSVHAGNQQGAVPIAMVNRIQSWYPGADIMGDFNEAPATFYPRSIAPQHHTWSARTADGRSGQYGPSVLDYLVVDSLPDERAAQAVTNIAGAGTPAYPSDHYPVIFGPPDENGFITCLSDPSERLATATSTLTALAKAIGAKYSYFAFTSGGLTTRYRVPTSAGVCGQILTLDDAGNQNGFALQAHKGQRDANVVSGKSDSTNTAQQWKPEFNTDGTVSYRSCANNQLLTADTSRATTRDDSDALPSGQDFTTIVYPDSSVALSTASAFHAQVNALPKASGAKYSYFGFGGSGATAYSMLEVAACPTSDSCIPGVPVYQILPETSTGEPNGFALQAHEGQPDANVVSGASSPENRAQQWQPVYNTNGTTSYRNVANGQFLTRPGTVGSTLFLTTRAGIRGVPQQAQMFLGAAVS